METELEPHDGAMQMPSPAFPDALSPVLKMIIEGAYEAVADPEVAFGGQLRTPPCTVGTRVT